VISSGALGWPSQLAANAEPTSANAPRRGASAGQIPSKGNRLGLRTGIPCLPPTAVLRPRLGSARLRPAPRCAPRR